MSVNGLYDKNQSAYRRGHSTETVLLKVADDILKGLDCGKEAILVLLDLSAAFDTVDHHILINRLHERLCLTGTILKWFSSYLQDRTLSVVINGCNSDPVRLTYGVPQGSVLEAILFTIYTLPLGDLMRKWGIPFQLYDDDNQLLNFIQCGNSVEGGEVASHTENYF
jgi:hypothetical protein